MPSQYDEQVSHLAQTEAVDNLTKKLRQLQQEREEVMSLKQLGDQLRDMVGEDYKEFLIWKAQQKSNPSTVSISNVKQVCVLDWDKRYAIVIEGVDQEEAQQLAMQLQEWFDTNNPIAFIHIGEGGDVTFKPLDKVLGIIGQEKPPETGLLLPTGHSIDPTDDGARQPKKVIDE